MALATDTLRKASTFDLLRLAAWLGLSPEEMPESRETLIRWIATESLRRRRQLRERKEGERT